MVGRVLFLPFFSLHIRIIFILFRHSLYSTMSLLRALLLPPLLLVLILTPHATVAAGQRKCYSLNGTELDSTYITSNPTARHSGCCGSTDISLDNGLCMATQGKFMGSLWQNGCTDPTGKDPLCPRLCPDGMSQGSYHFFSLYLSQGASITRSSTWRNEYD